jgi:hypothetical protein
MGSKFDSDIMKSGGVQCEDCHAPNKSAISRPDEKVCIVCHDASYRNTQLEWVKEIKSKSDLIFTLIKTMKNSNLSEEERSRIQYGKRLVSEIKTDGSSGIHNYMVMSSLLDKSIKEIKQIKPEQK